jgi:hypothetical protein
LIINTLHKFAIIFNIIYIKYNNRNYYLGFYEVEVDDECLKNNIINKINVEQIKKLLSISEKLYINITHRSKYNRNHLYKYYNNINQV